MLALPLIVSTLFSLVAAQSASGTGDAARGKDIYLRYSCYACHGYAGHGGAGPRLVPMRLSLPAFASVVRNPPTMPPYSAKLLSDAQLSDVWRYIRALPEWPPASRIPLLAK